MAGDEAGVAATGQAHLAELEAIGRIEQFMTQLLDSVADELTIPTFAHLTEHLAKRLSNGAALLLFGVRADLSDRRAHKRALFWLATIFAEEKNWKAAMEFLESAVKAGLRDRIRLSPWSANR